MPGRDFERDRQAMRVKAGRPIVPASEANKARAKVKLGPYSWQVTDYFDAVERYVADGTVESYADMLAKVTPRVADYLSEQEGKPKMPEPKRAPKRNDHLIPPLRWLGVSGSLGKFTVAYSLVVAMVTLWITLYGPDIFMWAARLVVVIVNLIVSVPA